MILVHCATAAKNDAVTTLDSRGRVHIPIRVANALGKSGSSGWGHPRTNWGFILPAGAQRAEIQFGS